MPAPWLDPLLAGAAALAQSALAVAIVLRRPGRGWQWLLGAHLALNALDAGLHLFGSGLSPLLLQRVNPLLQFLSSACILLLALAYPAPPRWLARPWSLPALAAGLLAAFLAAWLGGANLEVGLLDSGDWLGRLVANAFPALALTVLLLRWTPLLLQAGLPVPRREFTLIYGAYAVRAAHVALLVPMLALRRLGGGADPSYLGIALPALGLLLAALLACIGLALRALAGAPGPERASAAWALAFLGAGMLEILLSMGQAVRWGFGAQLVQADVTFLRPLLLWLALFPAALRSRAGLGAAAALAALAAWATFEAALQGVVGPTWLRLLLSGLPAVGVTAVAAALLMPRPSAARPGHDPSAVEAYLARAEEEHFGGPPDDAGRARLARHAGRLGLGEGEAAALEAAVATGWAVGGAPWTPGQRLKGRYHLREPLGQGAWGETWAAHDLEEGAEVVLKRTGRLDRRGREAILAEWATLRRLGHPRVVRLLGTQRLGNETVLVFPRHPASLEDLLRRGAVPPERVLALLRDLLLGLGAVHAQGLVHGDLKPANVLLDRGGRAVLADFGAAHPLPGLATATEAPAAAGTLAYMAPEQARGRPGTAASDLYSAALVACALLAGRHPLPDGLLPAEARGRVAAGLAPGLPAGLPPAAAAALRKALQPRPAHRFRSAAAFLRALGGQLDHEDAAADLEHVARRKRPARSAAEA